MKLFKNPFVFNKEEGYYEMSPIRKWLAIFVIALGGGTIYLVPYLIYSFKIQIINVTGASESQVQFLLTAYGLLSLFLYIPGGWLADRVPTKTLFAISMFGTGIVTFWYSLVAFKGIVDYSQLVIIHLFFSLTTVLTFWSAFIKSVKLLGSNKEQAQLYSKAEATRYTLQVIANYISVGLALIFIVASPFLVFNASGEQIPLNSNKNIIDTSSSGIFFSLLFYGIVYLITGFLSLILLPGKIWEKRTKKLANGKIEYTSSVSGETHIFNSINELKKYKKQQLKDFFKKVGNDTIEILKSPDAWLIAFLIFFIMNAYTVFSSYGTTILASLGVNSKLTPTLSVIYIYGIPILGGVLSGIFTKRVTKFTSKTLIFLTGFMIVVSSILLAVISLQNTSISNKESLSNSILWITFSLICFMMFFIGASRSIYWSTIAELKIKPTLVGLAVGFISIIGFSKDVWAGIFLAFISENNFAVIDGKISSILYEKPALIYWIIFTLINSIFALIIALLIYWRSKKINPKISSNYAKRQKNN